MIGFALNTVSDVLPQKYNELRTIPSCVSAVDRVPNEKFWGIQHQAQMNGRCMQFKQYFDAKRGSLSFG